MEIKALKLTAKMKAIFIFCSLLVSANAFSQVSIEITGEIEGGVPIAIVPFAGGEGLPFEMHEIVSKDLGMSGQFEPIPTDKFLSFPSNEASVQFKDWRTIGAELLVIAEMTPADNNTRKMTFLLYDVAAEKRVGGYHFVVDKNNTRSIAHKISDYVYGKRLGKTGDFSSKLTFVKREGKFSKLQISDWDGYGAKTLVTTDQPLMSPDWSPDASKIAFVTFNNGRTQIKSVDVQSGLTSLLVSSSKGLNSAPAWSPDGRSLAFSSSRSGGADIYVMDLLTKSLRKLTKHWGIDTNPTWSADGKFILFTSGRSGKANIYKVPATGGGVNRLTFSGKENGDAAMSPDGEHIVVIRDGGTSILTSYGELVRTLYDSGFDESPSFSPSGDMVLFGVKQGYNGKLVVSSIDGRAKQALDLISGNVRDSDWSSVQ